MPLLMEGFGGSIWPLALARTSEEQALGTPAPQAWPALSPEASPVLHLGESASAEASPLTHRGLQTAPAYYTSELPAKADTQWRSSSGEGKVSSP